MKTNLLTFSWFHFILSPAFILSPHPWSDRSPASPLDRRCTAGKCWSAPWSSDPRRQHGSSGLPEKIVKSRFAIFRHNAKSAQKQKRLRYIWWLLHIITSHSPLPRSPPWSAPACCRAPPSRTRRPPRGAATSRPPPSAPCPPGFLHPGIFFASVGNELVSGLLF